LKGISWKDEKLISDFDEVLKAEKNGFSEVRKVIIEVSTSTVG